MRGVEALGLVTDDDVKNADIAYLEQHGIQSLLSSTMQELLRARPAHPVDFMIDCIQHGPDNARVDAELGLPMWKRHQLEDAFRVLVEKAGKEESLSLDTVRTMSGSVSEAIDSEAMKVVQEMKESLGADGGDMASNEFVKLFAKAAKQMSNDEFTALVADLKE